MERAALTSQEPLQREEQRENVYHLKLHGNSRPVGLQLFGERAFRVRLRRESKGRAAPLAVGPQVKTAGDDQDELVLVEMELTFALLAQEVKVDKEGVPRRLVGINSLRLLPVLSAYLLGIFDYLGEIFRGRIHRGVEN